jgi:hypothetical protein
MKKIFNWFSDNSYDLINLIGFIVFAILAFLILHSATITHNEASTLVETNNCSCYDFLNDDEINNKSDDRLLIPNFLFWIIYCFTLLMYILFGILK